jgi:hypothetical protein
MTGHAASQDKKQQEFRTLYNQLIDCAVEVYQEDQQKPKQEKRHGFRTVTQDVQAEHYQKMGQKIELACKTVENRFKGTPNITQAQAEQSRHLAPEEADAISAFTIQMANRGFPFSLRRLQQHIDKLLEGTGRPCVGKNWPECFIASRKELATFYAQYLEAKRRNAVNPAKHKKWFDLLSAVLRGDIKDEYPDLDEETPPELIFGVDETNFQTAPSGKEHVIGPAKKKVQHQQRKGSQETITVIATICADRMALRPTVIFKGEHFHVSWDQENPLNAS